LRFSLYIAKRYLVAKSSNNTINIITGIAAVGVIIGTMALFIVLSGFTGLRNFSLHFLDVADPDLKITPTRGKTLVVDSIFDSVLKTHEGVAHYSKVIEERAFFEFNDKTHIAYLKGVDDQFARVSRMDTTVFVGTWLDPEIPAGAVVGSTISNLLSVGVYDFLEPLKVYVPKPGKGYINNPRNAFNSINAQPIGIFGLTEESDRKYTFVQLELARELLNFFPDEVSAVEIRVTDLDDRPQVVDELQQALGPEVTIQTREQMNAVFYRMLNTENLASYLIFTLIVIIALFNVIGAIIMMILDKRKNLKTLFNMGATIREIKQVFVLQGFLLTAFGLVVGLGLGVLLVFAQQKYSLFMITQHLPYPVAFTFMNLFTVIFTILILGFFASLIASSRITKNLIA
jgi:lipoprotein-releasing system permease protein